MLIFITTQLWYASNNHLDVCDKQCPEPLVQNIIASPRQFHVYNLKLKFGTSIWMPVSAQYVRQFVFPRVLSLVCKMSHSTYSIQHSLLPDFTKNINHARCLCVLCALKTMLRYRTIHSLPCSLPNCWTLISGQPYHSSQWSIPKTSLCFQGIRSFSQTLSCCLQPCSLHSIVCPSGPQCGAEIETLKMYKKKS